MSTSSTSTIMVTRLQALVERDKAALAREMHDDLGGFLIAAAMDVTLLRHRFAAQDTDSQQKFDRLARMLDGAIDLMRRVTEDLHPTLLDNVGLFAALRWQIKQMCLRSSIACTEHLPASEPWLPHAAAISLFRVGQEALVVAEHYPDARRVDFTMELDGDVLSMQVVADGAAGPAAQDNPGQCALGFLRHRIDALGGESSIAFPKDGGMNLSTQVSMTNALAFV